MNRRLRHCLRSLSTLALVPLVACGAEPTEAQEAGDPVEAAIEVEVAEAAVGWDIPSIAAVGYLANDEERRLGFEGGGRIAQIVVGQGERVRRGQLLARLDTGAIDAQVAHAQAVLEDAERDAARATHLRDTDSLASSAADDAATGLEMARASLRAARHHRTHASLVAPHDGIVLRRLAEPGEVVGPGAPVLVVSNGGRGHVAKVGVIDRDVVNIAVGSRASVRLDALPALALEGEVATVAQIPSAATGTYEVEIALPTDAVIPRSGLVARAEITPSARARVVTLPVEALFEADGARGVVYVLGGDGAHVERRELESLALSGGRVAVREGLAEGERVVIGRLGRLEDGARVTVRDGAVASIGGAP
jgi:membrane fusion protein, multidrug efflux system